MPSKTKIAKRLVNLRGDKTREEVALANNISVSALTMYETAHRVPRDELKKSLAQYYGVSVESIFFDD